MDEQPRAWLYSWLCSSFGYLSSTYLHLVLYMWVYAYFSSFVGLWKSSLCSWRNLDINLWNKGYLAYDIFRIHRLEILTVPPFLLSSDPPSPPHSSLPSQHPFLFLTSQFISLLICLFSLPSLNIYRKKSQNWDCLNHRIPHGYYE